MTSNDIILPTTYAAGYLRFVNPQVQFSTQAVTTAMLASVGGITLTQGVWDVRATGVFQTASGTSTGVSMVNAMIRTSTILNTDQLASTRLPVMNFSFGSSIDTSAYVPISRIYTVTGASQYIYLIFSYMYIFIYIYCPYTRKIVLEYHLV